MTEHEYRIKRRKEDSLYFWFNAISLLSRFLNAALIGSGFTLLIIGGYAYLVIILNLLAIAILLLGDQISKMLEQKWEVYFKECCDFMANWIKEQYEDERKD